jgi:hypothetical protein
MSSTPPATTYQSGGASLGSAQGIPFTPADVYTNKSSLKEGEEVIPLIPVLDTTWLTLQREKPTMARLRESVRYIRSLQQSLPQEAGSVSLGQKMTVLTDTLDDTLEELEQCLTSKSIRIHISRWLGFLRSGIISYQVVSPPDRRGLALAFRPCQVDG